MIAVVAVAEFLFDSKLGRRLLVALAVVAVVAWFAMEQRAKGAAKVLETSRQAGKIANAKNEKVRKAAQEPGAADRLRHGSCRDC